MSVDNKIFFHGAGPGIGTAITQIDSVGKVFTIKSIMDEGFAMEGVRLALASGLNHNIILRFPGVDIPDYSLEPELAANRLWYEQLKPVIDRFSNEIKQYKHMIYIEPVNELRTQWDHDKPNWNNMHPVDWLGYFWVEYCNLIISDGWKVAMCAMNAGTPEPEDWLLPGPKYFLALASENRDKVAITVHEGKLPYRTDSGEQLDMYSHPSKFVPFLIGRFWYIIDAFKSLALEPCQFFISEFAWSNNDMVSQNRAMEDVHWLMNNVYNSRYISGVCLWDLQRSTGGYLAGKMAGMIAPITEMTIDESFPNNPKDDAPPVDPPTDEDIFLFPPYVTRTLLHPKTLSDKQQKQINLWMATEMPDGNTIGFAGWTHQDSLERLHQSIARGETKSLLYIADGYQIGTGLDEGWMETNYPHLLSYTRFVKIEYPSLPINIIDITDELPKHPTLVYTTRNASDITALTVHHTVTPNTSDPAVITSMANYHINNNGWPGIGYHFVILENGTIYQTNKIDTISFHSYYDNLWSVGIALTGTFNAGQPTDLQKDALNTLMNTYLRDIIPTVVEIRPHRGMPNSATTCPGDTYRQWLPQIAGTLYKEKATDYVGPSVTFVPGIDQPASDWHWDVTKVVFDETKLSPKFHATGNSFTWYTKYKNSTFNLVRVDVSPSFAGSATEIFQEMYPKIKEYYDLGARNFLLFNEPNVEGLNVRWANGSEFGIIFKYVAQQAKILFPGVRIWHSPMSPSGITIPGDVFLRDAIGVGSIDEVYGMCVHSYTGETSSASAAATELTAQVTKFQNDFSLTKPLVVSEFSVNRLATSAFKSEVYLAAYKHWKAQPGIQAAYSFTSSWHNNPDQYHEGWLEFGIRVFFSDI